MRRKALDYLVLLLVTLVAGIALAGANRLGGGAGANRMATASAQGFAGPVAVTVTVDDGGAITAIEVGDDQFAETAGLGAKAKEPEFGAQFVGKTYPLALGEGIDAISGATVTSNAVIKAANQALAQLTGAGGGATTSTATASAKGYGGPVAVTVTIDGTGAITAIEVGDDQFAETTGLGARAQEPEFGAQFVGKRYPVALGEGIDAISGATVTSNAVIKAVNEALARLTGVEVPAATSGPDANSAATEAATSAPDANSAATETSANAGPQPTAGVTATNATAAVATVKGYGGMFDVTVTMDGAGAIQSVTVGGDSFNETAGLGAKAKDPEFAAQFVGKTYPVALGEGIDAISGATVTSKAVVDAVNQALKALQHP